MSVWDAKSDLVEIAKRNGDFAKNFGVTIGAILYLCSIFVARPASVLAWLRFITLAAGTLAVLHKFGWLTFLIKL